MRCSYCNGMGYWDTMTPPTDAFFKPEITREVCLACAGTGVDAEAQMRHYAEQRETERERRIKFNESRQRKADEWDRRHERFQKENRGKDSATTFLIDRKP